MTDPAPDSATATITVDGAHPIGPVNRRLFGGFVEHMGRGVYGGIHDPAHPAADADGFRADVIALVRELGMTVFRYPGGNFVSGYRWEDGVGPRASRPRRLNLAWHSTETNAVGLHEFADWVEKVDGELMLATNLGTRGVLEATDLLEYARIPHGTERAEQRRRNGRGAPFDVRMWCLGNELDGPWQLGQLTADEYGSLAARTAKAMRMIEPDLELVACGSSGPLMPTFGEWERTVLRHAYDDVDVISAHFYAEPTGDDLASFLASGAVMDAYLGDVIEHADAVRDERGSDKTLAISVDEWNVWYQSRMAATLPTGDDWPEAPALSEDEYTVADAVVVGDLLIAMLGRADRVTTACMAQVVNVIAPIAAPADGPARRRTTFHPFSLTARHARGTSLATVIDGPVSVTAQHGEVPALSAAAVRRDVGGVVVYVVNRLPDRAVETTIDLRGELGRGLGGLRVVEAVTMSASDSLEDAAAAAGDAPPPRANPTARADGDGIRLTLPAASWSMIRLGR